jgi:hypothetical protein
MRLKDDSMDEEQVRKTLQAAAEMEEEAKSGGFYDSVVEAGLEPLEAVVFASEGGGWAAAARETGDTAMEDGPPS